MFKCPNCGETDNVLANYHGKSLEQASCAECGFEISNDDSEHPFDLLVDKKNETVYVSQETWNYIVENLLP